MVGTFAVEGMPVRGKEKWSSVRHLGVVRLRRGLIGCLWGRRSIAWERTWPFLCTSHTPTAPTYSPA